MKKCDGKCGKCVPKPTPTPPCDPLPGNFSIDFRASHLKIVYGQRYPLPYSIAVSRQGSGVRPKGCRT